LAVATAIVVVMKNTTKTVTEVVASVGAAWGAEMVAEGGLDEQAAVIRRDPRGWWTSSAFDVLRDELRAAGLEAAWEADRTGLSEACANIAARVVLGATGG
jgi:hypothetical protein